MPTISTVLLDGRPLLTSDVERVARFGGQVEVASPTCDRLAESRTRMLRAISDGQTHYGLNTGFGALAKVRIDESSLKTLQVNLIRSHSTGVGETLTVDVVRATMLLLAASLCRGLSGVRPELVKLLVEMLNRGITPLVPETGSVGASGDLAPLAHIALVLIGEGEARVGDEVLPGGRALAANKLQPLELEAKEGLAMINGTHLMTGTAAMLVESFLRLFDAALVAAAMSVDTCRATSAVLDPRIHSARCQQGQIVVSENLRELLAGSEIVESHREHDVRVQDPYSFRCCPAVLGAAWDAFDYVREKVNAELGAVTDNPLVFPRENDRKSEGKDDGTEQGCVDIVSGGNFHGLPLALPLDVFAIAVSHLAGISERRIFHMLSGHDPEAELPTFLTPQAGLQSGLMIAQYTAAACCNELIGLANPASVANLSTSAGMEDYNSFGPRSAAKARRAVELARSVVSIELLCASTGLDHHRPLRSGERIEKAFESIRARIPELVADRPPAPDIRVLEEMIDAGDFSADDSSPPG